MDASQSADMTAHMKQFQLLLKEFLGSWKENEHACSVDKLQMTYASTLTVAGRVVEIVCARPLPGAPFTSMALRWGHAPEQELIKVWVDRNGNRPWKMHSRASAKLPHELSKLYARMISFPYATAVDAVA